jgi:amino acid permease
MKIKDIFKLFMETKDSNVPKTGFFQEAPNDNSITRLVFFIGCIWAMILTTYFVCTHPTIAVGEIVALVSGNIAPFLAMKLIQKPMENKGDDFLKDKDNGNRDQEIPRG